MKLYRLIYFILLILIVIIDYVDSESDDELMYSNGIRHLDVKQFELKKIKDQYIIEVFVGTPKQSILLKVSTLFKGIILISTKKDYDGFDEPSSQTYSLLETCHSNKFGKGDIATDIVEIPALNFKHSAFPFFLVTEPQFVHLDYAGLFGIAYNEENYSDLNLRSTFDFFDYLDDNHKRIINQIGFRSISRDTGVVLFGDLPFDTLLNGKLYKTCPITSKVGSHNWQCLLNAIYLDDGSLFKVNADINILIGGHSIEVSQEFLLLLFTKYFKKYPNCAIENEDVIEIVCSNDFDYKQIGMISFVLGKWTLKIKGEKLFYKGNNNKLRFAIVSDDEFTDWSFSPTFILNQYIFLDGNNSQIGFYNK